MFDVLEPQKCFDGAKSELIRFRKKLANGFNFTDVYHFRRLLGSEAAIFITSVLACKLVLMVTLQKPVRVYVNSLNRFS